MKTPPMFRENETDYEQWKKDIELWTSFTDLPKEKMAIAVHLSLTGRARQASSELTVSELKSDTGIDNLLLKLDRVFLQDKNWRCFNNYLAFENYQRQPETSIDQYLSEFDRRHYKLKESDVVLPDAVIACRLLKSCNLSHVQFQLALSTTTDMTFENMRATLKRLFSNEDGKIQCISSDAASRERVTDVGESSSSATVVKLEPVFESEAYYSNDSRRGVGRRLTGNRRGSGRGSNPIGADGSVTTCNVCGSKMHWARYCPHGYYRRSPAQSGYRNKQEDVQITLIATGSNFDDKVEVLFSETIGHILLDSGCSKTVCGEQWLSCYLDALSASEKSKMETEASSTVFKFGDGRRMTSLKCVTIPCVLADKNIMIRTDVVKCNIPLLLSKSSMKRAGMILNLNSDSAVIFGKNVKLETTSLGHYKLPIVRPLTLRRVEEVLIAVDDPNTRKVALKLHRQFAHPSAEKLRSLLKNARRADESLLRAVDEVTAACEICMRYKRPRPRPVVSMPMATSFNETVAMDLKSWQGVYFLVLVDLATRYCVATVIPNKSAEAVVESIFVFWITIFGRARQFLSDNGGEFNNDCMRALGDSYGIKLVCTAAESPWSNGVCERLNCVLDLSVRRIMEDTNCSVKVALAWAVAARNALQNCHGFSPNQLVFGSNPAIPSVFDSGPAELESSSASQLVADNINAMHAARRDFICNESNERIRRALLHQVRHDDKEDFKNGDTVYYKRNGERRWRSPGVVIGMYRLPVFSTLFDSSANSLLCSGSPKTTTSDGGRLRGSL